MHCPLIFVSLLTLFCYCAAAQNNTLPQCALLCAGTAATAAGCSSYSNATCVCASEPFQSAIQSCFDGNCGTTDQGIAWLYYSGLCTNGTSSTGSVSSTHSVTVSSAGTTNTHTSSGTVAQTSPTSSITSTNVSSSATSSSPTLTPTSTSGALVTDVKMLRGIMAVVVGGALIL